MTGGAVMCGRVPGPKRRGAITRGHAASGPFISRCLAVRRLGAAALAGAGAWLAFLTTTPTASAQAPCPSTPTPYQVLRYEEDYRYLEHPDCRTEWWDHVKYIRLAGDTR